MNVVGEGFKLHTAVLSLKKTQSLYIPGLPTAENNSDLFVFDWRAAFLAWIAKTWGLSDRMKSALLRGCNVQERRMHLWEVPGNYLETSQVPRFPTTQRGLSWLYFLHNIISGTAGGRKFQKRKHIEPIEMERLWFDVTHLFEELLLAFDWLPDQPN